MCKRGSICVTGVLRVSEGYPMPQRGTLSLRCYSLCETLRVRRVVGVLTHVISVSPQLRQGEIQV